MIIGLLKAEALCVPSSTLLGGAHPPRRGVQDGDTMQLEGRPEHPGLGQPVPGAAGICPHEKWPCLVSSEKPDPCPVSSPDRYLDATSGQSAALSGIGSPEKRRKSRKSWCGAYGGGGRK